MSIHFDRTRDCLKQFDFQRLFCRRVGLVSSRAAHGFRGSCQGRKVQVRHIGGTGRSGRPGSRISRWFRSQMPGTRAAVHKGCRSSTRKSADLFGSRPHPESLVLGQTARREVLPPGSPFLQRTARGLVLTKLGQMVFDLADFDAKGNVSIVEGVETPARSARH